MLQKKPLSGNKVEVTFVMPPLDDVVSLYLCGDFNGWSAAGAPLHQVADGSWVVTLVLDAGKSYRFRYHDNQGLWHNDWEADAYVPNDFGTEDSVLDLMRVPFEHAKGATKKAPAKSAKPASRRASPSRGKGHGGRRGS